jgi:hypothetical protein
MATSEKKEAGVPAKIYYSMFQGHPDGQKILDELAQKFYDRSSITNPVDPNATLVMEGERRVILFILGKCAEGQK